MKSSGDNAADSLSTDETQKKILDIIDHQFDLEIYLKQREVSVIRSEIEKAENILVDIEAAVKNEAIAAAMPEAAHYTRQSASLMAAPALPSINTAPSKKIPSNSMQKSQLFGRRNDGVFVRLACPACHRDDFLNQQGFLNHCRLAHNLEFGPYEQMLLRCGTPIDESEVPPDHPVRTRPVTKPVPSARPKKKDRPSIKVFEEDVDLGMGPPSSTQTSVINSPPTSAVLESPTSSTSLPPPDSSTSTPTSAPTPTISAAESRSIPSPSETTRSDIALKSVPETQKDTTITDQETGLSATPIESVVSALDTSKTADGGSRFYIKRQVVVGNVSKFIPLDKRDADLKHFSHKWMIYVVEPPQSQDISTFVTNVRFHLHPSYKPNHIVDVKEAPFRLTRLGWGEFPIRIQLHFVDMRRNKTVNIFHQLRLDDTHSGKQVLGSERCIEIELDRNTDFSDTGSPLDSMVPQPKLTAVNAIKQRMTLFHGMLKECVTRWPIISTQQRLTQSSPFSCAPNVHVYFSWPVGKRKGIEWHRAHLMRCYVQQRSLETLDDVLRTAAESLSTKDVLLWCREYGYSPRKTDQSSSVTMGYCKYCGGDLLQHPSDQKCLRRPLDWSGKRGTNGPSSVTSVTSLLSALPNGWNEDKGGDDVDIDIDQQGGQRTIPALRAQSLELIDLIREWGSRDTMDIANERLIDWVWSVIGQLRMKCAIANDIVQGRDGNLQGSNPHSDLTTALDQRVVVGNLMAQATRVFLHKLLEDGIDIWRQERETEPNGAKLLIPFHIYQAAQRKAEMDFITNKYMGQP